MEDNNGYVYTLLHIWYIMDGYTVLVYSQGQIQDFSRGGLEVMVIYKLYYIYFTLLF